MPEKKADPGLPKIPISINGLDFEEVICDSGASVNVMPWAVFNKVLRWEPLKTSKIHLRFADRSVRRIKGIVHNVQVRIKDSYVLTDFVVLHTGYADHKAPIILGRPFLHTADATIYMGTSEIYLHLSETVIFPFQPFPDPPRRYSGQRRRQGGGPRNRRYD